MSKKSQIFHSWRSFINPKMILSYRTVKIPGWPELFIEKYGEHIRVFELAGKASRGKEIFPTGNFARKIDEYLKREAG